MKSNKPLVAILVALILVAMCACVGSVALFGWTLRDEIAQFIKDPQSVILQEQNPSAQPDETTPLGEEVDLHEVFAPMWEVRDILRDQFFDQPVSDDVFAQGALTGLSAFLENQGVDLADLQAPADAPSASSLASDAGTPDEAMDAFAPFWEAWRSVQYGGTDIFVTYQDLLRASLHEAVHALGDPHTNYMDPLELHQADMELEGNYEGIGAWVDTTTEFVTIIAPMEGSPAEAAGLKAGDVVIAVDGQDMTGIDGNVVISHILGPAGSTVVLTIQREGEPAPFDVSIVRGQIFVPSVESEMLPGGIGYIQLFTFGSDSADEMHKAIQTIMDQNPNGLIVDLRNNGGGFLDTAVSITSEFIDDGVVLYEEYNDGSRNTYDAESGGLALDVPLVILVNGGTASASEILAGAIQDHMRGQLVGETTFGKGSVQISRTLANNQGALRVTIAHWLTPDERLIHGLGLEPDVVVPLTDEDVQAGRDPQLDRAVELLGGSAGN
jgi:carboxyl-terminal processing protease